MPFQDRLLFHAIGDWPIGHVQTHAVPDRRQKLPLVESIIDDTWARTLANPGTRNLFDGPICRLDHFDATPQQLDLFLSLTSYKTFVGTHLSGESVFSDHGPSVMANPLGVSCALETADGFLLLGRRNNSVAYYPGRIHPFAGSMDPRGNPAPDVFDEIRRELREEIGLQSEHLTDIRCVALIEDVTLHHPELMFTVRTSWTRADVEVGLDLSEHEKVEATKTERSAIEQRLHDRQMTPVAQGAIALWGLRHFGDDWFQTLANRRL